MFRRGAARLALVALVVGACRPDAPRARVGIAIESSWYAAVRLAQAGLGAIRGVLERFLRREGSRVIVASGGREAINALRAEPVDAVLLDLRMPDLDGAQVYRVLLAERAELAGRTVFLSGDITGVAEELGVPDNRVLLKPIELADLKRVLLDLLNGV